MFGTPDFAALANMGQTYLAVRIGEMRFGLVDTCILVLALSAALLAAFNLWRIAQGEGRQNKPGAPVHTTILTNFRGTIISLRIGFPSTNFCT